MKKLLAIVSVALSFAVAACGDATVVESGLPTSAPQSTDSSTTNPDSPTPTNPEQPVRVLTLAGESFGMCAGWCRGELRFNANVVTLTQLQWQNNETRTNSGQLTTSGLARLVEIEAPLADAELKEQYGCPDCADGGASWVVLDQPTGEVRSEYNFSGPPPELAGVDAFVDQLRESLETCSATEFLALADDCQVMGR